MDRHLERRYAMKDETEWSREVRVLARKVEKLEKRIEELERKLRLAVEVLGNISHDCKGTIRNLLDEPS